MIWCLDTSCWTGEGVISVQCAVSAVNISVQLFPDRGGHGNACPTAVWHLKFNFVPAGVDSENK